MERVPLITKDGSNTISIPEMNVTYHSIHGAIQESMHVFIQAGLQHIESDPIKTIRILEIGLGTGLNVLLSLIENEAKSYSIDYTALEPFPLKDTELALLNYCAELKREDLSTTFKNIHDSEWDKPIHLSKKLTLTKKNISLELYQADTSPDSMFHLIYFDAFGPRTQPELWTKEIFSKLHSSLYSGGILVTYCSKSDVRRAMKEAGFIVEKIQGPLGKREMVRATRSKMLNNRC